MAVTSGKTLLGRSAAWMKKGAPTLLDLNGAILLSVGANQIYGPAGWITAGIAVFAINWRIHGD